MSINFKDIKLHNVTIGDRFRYGKHTIAEVVDFWEVKSMEKDIIIKYICIARGVNTLATNEFEVPFATVVRNRIKE